MTDARTAYESLIARVKDVATLGSVTALVQWDEQTQMPPKGAASRAKQMALLARMGHEAYTAPEIGELLSRVEGSDVVKDPEGDAAVNVRELRRTYDRARRLPTKLVEEMAETESGAYQAWVAARKASDYATFEPWLGKVLNIKRRVVECHLGRPARDGDEMYDVMLEDYEPGETTANLRRVFSELRPALVELVGKIASSGRAAPVEILERKYPVDRQQVLAREAAVRVGYDVEGGRLDVSAHPFSTHIAPGDARITTRYDENYFGDAFFGTLHEAGHAMYNQGLPEEHFGTPRGSDLTLGIHESQSRMWENLVGRSRAFWAFMLPRVRELFPEALAGVSDEAWYRAVNDVRPSLIRTEADEATYNLHVMLRFELEQALLSGELATKDLPAAWNRKMKEYLGVDVPDDARGCLQDIHWSGGGIGYFPTYTLGNLYAAQFYEKAKADVPDLEGQVRKGEFGGLLGWLRANIHSQGKRFKAPELCRRVTGQPLSAAPLLRHLRQKAADVYGVGA